MATLRHLYLCDLQLRQLDQRWVLVNGEVLAGRHIHGLRTRKPSLSPHKSRSQVHRLLVLGEPRGARYPVFQRELDLRATAQVADSKADPRWQRSLRQSQ